MKKILSLIVCYICLAFFLVVPASAADMELQRGNIPEDIKSGLIAAYSRSRSSITGAEISMMNEADLIGVSNFGPEIMGGLFSDGSFVLTGSGDMTYRPSDIYDDFITSVYVDKGITGLYDECFRDCTALEYVYIMGTVSDLGDYTFENCSSLHTIVLEEGVKGMGEYTFSECRNIQNLKLPSSLQLTSSAFNNCTSLVTAGPMNGSYIVEFSWKSVIPDNAFCGLYYLQEVTIPEGVTDIGSYAFGDCTSLSLVCIPESLKNIRSSAFYNMQDDSWVYYAGNQSLWNKINISSGNENLQNAYFYYNTVPQLTVAPSNNSTPEISWKAVPYALGYEVFYALNDGTYYEYLTSAAYPATSVTHTTAVTGETYRYVVRALMPENRYADFSRPAVFTVPSPVPVLSVRLNSNDKPVLSWNAVAGAEKYRLYRSATGKENDYTLLTTTAATSVTNTGPKPGITYYYKVQTYSDTGIGGPFSKRVSVTIPVPMTAPLISVKLNNSGRPTVRWDAVKDAVKYEVYHSYTENGPYSKLAVTEKNSITDTAAKEGKHSWYKIIPVSYVGNTGPESKTSSVYVPYQLAAPDVKVSLNSNGKPVINWAAVVNGEQYELYRSESINGSYKKLITTPKNTATNSGAADGKTYYYKVRAVAPDGATGPFSKSIPVTVYGAAARPVITVTLNSSGKPVISWKPVADAAKYEVYRSYGADGSYTKLITTTKTSVTNSGAAAHSTCYYKVIPVYTSGKKGPESNISSVYIPDVQAAPVVTVVLNSSGKPVISWKPVADAAKYEVYRSYSADGSYTKLITTTKTSVTNSGAAAHSTCYYKVVPVYTSGKKGPESNISSVYIPDGLVAPVINVKLNSSGKPVISWTVSADGAKYELYRSDSADGVYTKLVTTSKNTIINSGAPDNKVLYYKVCAVLPDNTKSPLSAAATWK